MRLHILSDLHLEFAPFEMPVVDADVVVLAGDVHTGDNGLNWIRTAIPRTPVIYVLGNHEFYGQTISKLTDELRQEAHGTNVHILENSRIDLGDVTFLGASLWTDFALNGDAAVGGIVAEQSMNDFRLIRTMPGYSKLRASYLRELNAESVLWLRAEAEACRSRKVVVVTHCPPSARSISPIYAGEPLNAAFASHLDALVADTAALLWVHGHTHSAADYAIGRTRVLGNPRGYPSEAGTAFKPDLVVEI
ncbi:MAG: metallophosphoesterase [Opitutaceae bacterium]|nr:metallophosphoesterase [Opitutaceae bacterium]